jgi:RNA polymerase primary sigma factor
MACTQPDNTLRRYLDEVGRHRLLSRSQEITLGRLAAAGDSDARERLVESNLRLVVAIARRYRGLGLDYLDLIQEGNLGLIAAVERFDWRRNSRFATFATWSIRQSIFRALSTHSRLVRLPARVANASSRVRRAEDSVSARLGRQPTVAEVADEAGVDAETVALLRQAARAIVSLDQPVAGELTVGEMTADPDADVDDVHHRDVEQWIREGFDELAERPRQVIALRYGLDGGTGKTLTEVAERIGVSRERVRRVETKALLSLAASTRIYERAAA